MSGLPEGEADRVPARRWVASTYFAEGLPYSVVNNLPELVATQFGASLSAIGLTSLLHLPWNLKFLWGHVLDEVETKRRWMLAVQATLTVALAVLAVAAALEQETAVAWGFVALAFLSATQDIAIDGYYLEALDASTQSRFVGHRAMAFKVASLFVTGPLVLLIGLVLRWGGSGWATGLGACAAIMGVLLLLHSIWLPRRERGGVSLGLWLGAMARRRGVRVAGIAAALGVIATRVPALEPQRQWLIQGLFAASNRAGVGLADAIALMLLLAVAIVVVALAPIHARLRRTHESRWAQGLADLLDRPGVRALLAFVVLFRVGESFLLKMKYAFLHRAFDLSLDAYGLVNGTFGVLASFAGTLVGGRLIARDGLRRWIWPFVLAQNVLNLGFAALALHTPGPTTLVWISALVFVEQFGAGLGIAVLMVVIMRACDARHRAAHMALLSAIMSIGFTLAGVWSGALAERVGFPLFFLITFLATIPSMALIPALGGLDDPPADSPPTHAPARASVDAAPGAGAGVSPRATPDGP